MNQKQEQGLGNAVAKGEITAAEANAAAQPWGKKMGRLAGAAMLAAGAFSAVDMGPGGANVAEASDNATRNQIFALFGQNAGGKNDMMSLIVNSALAVAGGRVATKMTDDPTVQVLAAAGAVKVGDWAKNQITGQGAQQAGQAHIQPTQIGYQPQAQVALAPVGNSAGTPSGMVIDMGIENNQHKRQFCAWKAVKSAFDCSMAFFQSKEIADSASSGFMKQQQRGRSGYSM